jgi:integrating conjugative element membrane protein (TIGR03747 family)
MAIRAPVFQRELRQPNTMVRAVRGLGRLVALLVLALLFSILLECLGMTFLWVDQGPRHSERMLATELQYLNDDFTRSVFTARPVELGLRIVNWASLGLDWVRVNALIAWLHAPVPCSPEWSRSLHDLLQRARSYLEATANIIKVFAVRLAVLALATPVFALFGLVGMGEGLMRRDLRRWGGGRESSFLYHHSKKILGPSVVAAWMLYLAVPVSIHPNTVLLPFAVLFAAGIAITTATFKKYL